MNLVEVLGEQVRQRPQAAAIIETKRGVDRVTTFAELNHQSGRMAARLKESGIGAGDPVLIFHPMSAELYAVLLGVFRIGAVAMFLDPSAGHRHIDRCCELQPPKALIASPKAHLLRLVSSALRRVPRKFVVGPWLPGAASLVKAGPETPFDTCEPCAADAAALLTFTSGSTGIPKAAIRTHGFLLAQHQVLERHIRLVPGEVDLTTLPIFLLANLASGVTSVIPDADLKSPGRVCPKPILDQIQRLGVSRCVASPAFFERLLEGGDQARAAFVRLRKIYTGGAPVFLRLLDQLTHYAPDGQVEAVYGSTEAEPIAHLNAGEISRTDRLAMRRGAGLLSGVVIAEIRLRIIHDRWGQRLGPFTESEFDALKLAPDQTGEIVVAGDHVLKGYLHGRGNEETKFQVGHETWHRTGDAGRLDSSGRLWLLGRCAAKIQDAHGEIYPFAVECVAMEQPSIRRAAFVNCGQKRLLAIEAGAEFNDTVRQALAQELDWARLDDVRLVKHLPVDKRHNAKIDYPALLEMLRSE
jgi:acyl-CoA synthetase (AMP-forming)/AMP-acid ligase II